MNEKDLEVRGTHTMDDKEIALFGLCYDFIEKFQQTVNLYFAEKHGYNPNERPIGFRLDFHEKQVIALSPKEAPKPPKLNVSE